MEAMHKNCVACHREEQKKGVKKGLGECYTCHPSLRARVTMPQMDVARLGER